MTARLRLVKPRNHRPEERALLDDSVHRYRDTRFDAMAVKVMAGEHYITRQPEEMLVALLGSSLAVCIRDPIARLGGMSHFLLPVQSSGPRDVVSLRFGERTMERLIDDLEEAGAERQRFEIKLFGGGNLPDGVDNLGHRTADFVELYMKAVGLPVVAHQLRGELPRRIHYFPVTGRVFVLKLRRTDDRQIAQREEADRLRLRRDELDRTA
jgi:chemotaxis protein CheD